MWDGWMRLNFETKEGGIIGVFRQGAAEQKRIVTVRDLDPGRQYSVRLAPEGKEILKATGKDLMEKGFEVEVNGKCDGNIYEIAVL
jgi:alpha-galactosidase